MKPDNGLGIMHLREDGMSIITSVEELNALYGGRQRGIGGQRSPKC